MATQDVACGARLWRTAGQLRVTLACKATFAMVEGGPMRVVAPAPIVVTDEHAGADTARSVLVASDLVPYRPRGEVVFAGHAHAPNGSPCASLTARLAVIGQRPYVDKSIHVFGERVVLGEGQLSAPVPFTRMPIVYDRSIQHPDENPSGMPSATGAPAPNLVDPQDAASPTGFGPIAASWPVRRRMLRQLDPAVVETNVPEIPDAFAWSYFQAAPPDQRCPFFEGNEWLVLDGLHPDRAHFETQLPAVRAAARLYQPNGGEALGDAPYREFPLTADTLFVDGDRGLVCLVWRGNLDIDQAQLATMQVLAGLEVGGRGVPWPQSSIRPAPPSQRSSAGPPLVPRADGAVTPGSASVTPGSTSGLYGAVTGHGSGAYPAASISPAAHPALTSQAQAQQLADGRAQPPPQPPPQQSQPPTSQAPVSPPPLSPSTHMQRADAVPPSAPPVSSVAFSSMPTPHHPSIVPSEAMTNRRPETASQPGAPTVVAPSATSPTTMEVQADWLEPDPSKAAAKVDPTSHLKATMPVTDLEALLRDATPASLRSASHVRTPPSNRTPQIDVLTPPPVQRPGDMHELTGPHPAPREVTGPQPALRDLTGPQLAVPAPQPAGSADGDEDAPDTNALPRMDGGESPQSLNPTTMRRPKFDDPETFQPDSDSLAQIVHNAELAIGRRGPSAAFGAGTKSAAPPTHPPAPLVARKLTPGPMPIQRTPTPPPISISQDPDRLAAQARARAAEAAAQGAAAARQHIAAGAMRKVRPPKTTIRGLGDPFRRPSNEPHPAGEADAFSESEMAGGFLDESTTGGADVEAVIAKMLPHLQQAREQQAPEESAPETRASLGGMNLPPLSEPPPAPDDTDDGGGATRISDASDPAVIEARALALEAMRNRKTPVPPPPAPFAEAAAPPRIAPLPTPVVAPPEQAPLVPSRAGEGPGAAPSMNDARAEVMRRVETGETLAGMSLEGVDLSNLDLSSCNLSGARLKGASLRSAKLAGVDLTNAQLDGADLTHAKLDGANLERASLRSAILSDASLRGAKLTDADFEGAIGTSATFDDVAGDRVRFVGGRFDCARFDRAALEAADFSEAIVDGASFVSARLVEARLYEIRGESVTFTGATLTGARLDTSVLARAQFQGIDAADSLWDQAEIDQASFDGAKLAGASFIKASCREASFEGADLADARFNRSILWGARFTNATADGANFDGADTRGAVLPTPTA